MVTTPVSMPLATTGPVSAATIAKVTQRLLPFLLLMYVLAFLDRANVGFAKKAFQLDTNISDAAFAFGASIFFLGYAVLEVPSNLIMHKVGARAWMCRIMVSWGLLSAAMMFAYSEVTFYIFRFLLGVAEAGFFPGRHPLSDLLVSIVRPGPRRLGCFTSAPRSPSSSAARCRASCSR